MQEPRPNDQRAKTAITLIWLILIINIVTVVSGYFQYDLLRKLSEGVEVSTQAINANDLRERIIAILASVTGIISVVTFIRWFRRAYFNLHLKTSFLRFNEGWAAGSWFVPIINLYRPLQIMKELYRKTKELLPASGPDPRPDLSTGILGWWWTLLIINYILDQGALRISLRYQTINDLMTATVVDIVSSVVGIFSCLITIKVIKDYSDVEPLLSVAIDEIDAIGAGQ